MAKKMQVHIKVWIADEEGQVIFGAGRMKLLDAVQRTGSILQASEEMAMSYRSAWGRIRATEQRLGEAVIEKVPGAGRRGGSRLTPRGWELLQKYHQLIEQLEKSSKDTFGELFLLHE